MNQDERNAKNVADLAKLQAIKETTERLLHSDEENTHTLIMIETIRKGEEIETISRVMADGDIRQILLSVGGLLKTAKEMMNSFPDDFIETAKETRKKELFELFMQSAEIGAKLMDWCGIGEE
jgi:hypothetical protein